MQKLSYAEFHSIMSEHAAKMREDPSLRSLTGYIVYKESNWPDKNYPVVSRTYEVDARDKIFNPNAAGSGLFGYCLDGSDQGVRLDWYNWEIDYCYFKSVEDTTNIFQ